MKVELRCPRGGQVCWNAEALTGHAERVTASEERLAHVPGVTVVSGNLACSSWIENEWGNGTFCGVSYTKTQVVVDAQGPVQPASATTSPTEISGYQMVRPGSGRMASGYVPANNEASALTALPTVTVRPGGGVLRFLGVGRRSRGN